MDKKLKTFFKIHVDHEQETHQNSQIAETSKFYFACRNGDIDTVKRLIPTIPYDQLNKLEPNKTTPLHAATYYGHLEIVRILLDEYGCQHNQRNLYDLTAYEEAQTDEMRQLYHRPSNINRFSDELNELSEMFQMTSSSTNKIETNDDDDDDDENGAKPNQKWLNGYETNKEIKKQLDGFEGAKTLFQSRLGRFIMKKGMEHTLGKKDCGYDEKDYEYFANKLFPNEAIHKILDEYVTIDHPQYKKCCHLLSQYSEHDNIESLLTLYSMETPFYKKLSSGVNPLAIPLYTHLSNLKQRYYQGQSYRGINITQDQLSEYRWALKNKDRIISTVKFASTSIVRREAENFVNPSSPSSHKIGVLLVLNFPKSCDTAIYLGKIDKYQLPCISRFENEDEVLVAPKTIFKVTEMEINSLNGQHIIYLENIIGDQKTLLETVKFFLKLDWKNRYHH